jgi:hypothetical protein
MGENARKIGIFCINLSAFQKQVYSFISLNQKFSSEHNPSQILAEPIRPETLKNIAESVRLNRREGSRHPGSIDPTRLKKIIRQFRKISSDEKIMLVMANHRTSLASLFRRETAIRR